jgi:glycosyltransferase 2 family protein
MTDETPSGSQKQKGFGWKVLVTLAIFALIGWYCAKQVRDVWPEIKRYNWDLDWRLALLALLALLVCSWLDILIWNRTLGWFTDRLPFRKAAPVYIWSYLARYIPGKVGSLLVRVGLAREVDREAIPVLASSAVELLLRTATALVLGLVAILAWLGTGDQQANEQAPFLMGSAGILILIVLVCAQPSRMIPAVNFALKLAKKPPISHTLTDGEVLAVLGALLIRWVCFGLAFWLIALAITEQARTHALVLVALGPGSWAIGFLSMFPGGLGSMEATQLLVMKAAFGLNPGHFGLTDAEFLSSVIPAVVVARESIARVVIISVLTRLFTLASEGLWSLAVIPLRARWKRDEMP